MIPPLDPFVLRFDSIELDPTHAPTAQAIERAMALCMPKDDEAADAPGFYLLDDADGRFDIDRDFGVVSLKDEGMLEREAGAIHSVRLRVVEPSGANYELSMRLRLTGRIPRMVGGEENDILLGIVAPPAAAAPNPAPPPFPWEALAAARVTLGSIAGTSPFGAAIAPPALSELNCEVDIAFEGVLPLPAAADADWPI